MINDLSGGFITLQSYESGSDILARPEAIDGYRSSLTDECRIVYLRGNLIMVKETVAEIQEKLASVQCH